jgi:hypothetical protein
MKINIKMLLVKCIKKMCKNAFFFGAEFLNNLWAREGYFEVF